jgi:prepilin peptidase CpaA
MTTLPVLAFDLSAGLLLITAAVSDVRRLTIPNWIILALIVLYAVRCITALASAEASPTMLLPIPPALAVLLAGAFAFQRGWLGGGDVKLLAATSLWLPPERLPDFLTLVALFGGALALLVLAGAKLAAAGLPGRAVSDIRLPYGVAISSAGLVTLFGIVDL